MRKAIGLIFLILMIGGCNQTLNQTYNVVDVTKPEIIIIAKQRSQGGIHSLRIAGVGQITGNATISLFLNGKPYKVEHLSESVDFYWGGDWYSDSAEIKYEPTSVKSGKLKINYQFYDI